MRFAKKNPNLIKSLLTKAVKVYVGQSNHSQQNEAECKIMLSWYRRMASGANPGTGQHKLFHLLFLLSYFSVEKTKFPVGLHSFYTTQPNLLSIFCFIAIAKKIVSKIVKNFQYASALECQIGPALECQIGPTIKCQISTTIKCQIGHVPKC